MLLMVQVTIRDVPEAVRDELAARAARRGKSMQEYLRGELERIAARPTLDEWLERVRLRKDAAQTRISSEEILRQRDHDRR
jgi:plasmid stability protein